MSVPERFPRLPGVFPAAQSAEEIAVERELVPLVAETVTWLARGRPANIEAGRRLFIIKKRLREHLGHGHWKSYFAKWFAPHGITLRTAENYMVMAREEDAKIENLSIMATDAEAREGRATRKKAEEKIGHRKGKKDPIRVEGPSLYRLPGIHLSGDERDSCDELVESHWPHTEKAIIALLKKLSVECGLVDEDAGG